MRANDNYDLQTSHSPALIRKFHEAKVTNAPAITCWDRRPSGVSLPAISRKPVFLMRITVMKINQRKYGSDVCANWRRP
jgi:hypothetical protein